jgi:exosortase/archaeosortase family protein
VNPARAAEGRFVLTFAALAGGMSLAYFHPWGQGSALDAAYSAYLRGYATVAGTFIGWFDPTVRVVGQEVVGRFGLRIIHDCDAMETNILYVAAIVAFSASWTQRAVGLAAGLAAISAANIVRLCALYLVGLHWPAAFDMAHREIAPLMIVTVALGAFVGWSGWTNRSAPAPGHAGA